MGLLRTGSCFGDVDILHSGIKNGSVKRSSHEFLHAQDLVVILKLAVMGSAPWTYPSLAASLRLSPSQVHTSVRRLERCDLYSVARRAALGRNLVEFVSHGVRYVFPASVGPPGRGIPTASSAPPLSTLLPSGGERFVWASRHGDLVGLTVDPLIPGVPDIVTADPGLGEVLALVDAIRIGKARERTVAIAELKRRVTDSTATTAAVAE